MDYFYNKHIRLARKAAKGLSGLDRAEAIYRYFANETSHPHAKFTYEQMMINRGSDSQFPMELMKKMASLTAENEWLAFDNKHKITITIN